jgi:hypothetical protein
MPQLDYYLLLHKSITGNISPEENSILKEWLSNPNNKEAAKQVTQLWHAEWNDEIFSELPPANFNSQRQRLIKNLQHEKQKETLSLNHSRIAKSIIGISLCLLLLVVLTQQTQQQPSSNKLHFKQEELASVMWKLKQHYNIQVKIIRQPNYSKAFTGTFINEDINNIMDIVCKAMSCTMEVRDGVYYITGSVKTQR